MNSSHMVSFVKALLLTWLGTLLLGLVFLVLYGRMQQRRRFSTGRTSCPVTFSACCTLPREDRCFSLSLSPALALARCHGIDGHGVLDRVNHRSGSRVGGVRRDGVLDSTHAQVHLHAVRVARQLEAEAAAAHTEGCTFVAHARGGAVVVAAARRNRGSRGGEQRKRR